VSDGREREGCKEAGKKTARTPSLCDLRGEKTRAPTKLQVENLKRRQLIASHHLESRAELEACVSRHFHLLSRVPMRRPAP